MMMRRTVVSGIAMMLAAASLTLSAYAQQSSTAFTYQGFLKDNNNPANARYNLRFTLYDAETGGNQIGNPVVKDVEITNGLFTVEIDFGINPFSSGQRRWIEIGVRPFNSTRPFVILDPRIELTPVPYAIYAQKAKDAENAQNARNAQNAENAVNAQNAQNAQNAETADVANSVAPDSVDSEGLANDANSLSKVSGRALSIENGHLKRANNVYFWAQKLRTFGNVPNSNRLYLVPSNLPGQAGRAYGLAIEPSSALSQGIQYDYVGGEEGGVFTIPVSGFYAIHFASVVETISRYWGGVAALQLKREPGDWTNIAYCHNPNDAAFSTTNSLSGTFYLEAGDKIRIVGISNDGTLPKIPVSFNLDYPQTLTIYLLSAADRPSN
jgi:hypothetical protein